MEARIARLNQTMRGWVNYYILADMRTHCQKTDEWLRRRLRMCYWKQWKKIGAKHDNLVCLGISSSKTWEYANTRKGYWHIANSHILPCSLTNDHFRKIGLTCLSEVYSLSLRTAVCRTARTVV
jgi:RNA-directed DNA polymerase